MRYFVNGKEVWILRASGRGFWVCEAITPDEEENGERPGNPVWVEAYELEKED